MLPLTGNGGVAMQHGVACTTVACTSAVYCNADGLIRALKHAAINPVIKV